MSGMVMIKKTAAAALRVGGVCVAHGGSRTGAGARLGARSMNSFGPLPTTREIDTATPFKGVLFGLWGVVAKPSFSNHEETWEKKNKLPIGTFRRHAEVEEGAIENVLEGKIGTTEGGARLLQEFMEEGVHGCETLTPMECTGQIRKILEAAKVNQEMQHVISSLRFQGLHTGLLCNQWQNAGKSISRPEQVEAKYDLEKQFTFLLEARPEGLKLVDTKFYKLAAERIGVESHELVYIDTRLPHLTPAKHAGMTTIHYTTPQALVVSLQRLGLVRGWSGLQADDATLSRTAQAVYA